MKTLIFAEKPSVGRDIARILGVNRRMNGYMENDKYVVTWGFGHLVSIASPETQNPNWKKWTLSELPMLPSDWKLTVLPSCVEQFKTVSRLMNSSEVTEIINAADAGREGELIFRLVYNHSGINKPFKRLWISSMTDEAIKEGFSKLKDGKKYDPLARAAICRSRADWLVGMNLTRLYTKKQNMMFTLGRVQTPTLAMVVARHLEIKNFKPQDYWELIAVVEDFSLIWYDPAAKENSSRILSQDEAKKIAERTLNNTIKIDSVKKTSKSQPPPLLYDLTTLQREANSKYSMTAAETLSVLQTLYEKKKLVTYPRTDSRYLSNDIFPTIEKRLAALRSLYEQYLGYLRDNRPKKNKRVFNDKKVSDHHAIIPTEKNPGNFDSLTKNEQRIYDLIARRFLAVFYPDHKYLSTRIIAKNELDHFKATGKVVTHEGWKVLYPQSKKNLKKTDSEQEPEQNLPAVKKGDIRRISETELETKKTKPPAEYTEATLLQSMETAGKLVEDQDLRDAMKESGLGTPATRAEIIEKLIKVDYIQRDKKKLIPTQKALHLISVAADEIKSPQMTGKWEKRLTDISKELDNETAFMKDIRLFVENIVARIKSDTSIGATHLINNNQKFKNKHIPPRVKRKSYGLCPACKKGNIIEGKKGFGCDRFKEGCHYVVWKEFYGKKLSEKSIQALISGKQTRLLKGFKMPDGNIAAGRLGIDKKKNLVELFIE